jgi:hypothetical protein
MRAIERTRTGVTRAVSATAEGRMSELPPPSAASMRAVARHRGAFAESLPTLRLPRVGLAAVAQAPTIEEAVTLEVVLESDGVPIAIPPRITMELGSADVAIDDDVHELAADDLVESPHDRAIAGNDGDQERCVEAAVPVGGWFPELVGARYDEDARRWADELDPRRVDVAHDECRVDPVITICEPAADVVVVGNTVRAPAPVAAPRSRRSMWWVAGVAALAAALGYIAALEVHVVPRRVAPVLAGMAEVPQRVEVAAAAPATPPRLVPLDATLIVPVPIAAPAATPPVATAPVATPPVATAPVATPPVATPPISTPPVATPPVATSSPTRVSTATPRRRAVASESADEPDVESAPIPVAASAPLVPNADMLMREALRAFSQSRWATAFHYTERARALGPNVAASRLAAISACHLRRIAKAEVAYRELPAGQRAGVRNTCRAAGVELPEPGA